MHIASRFTFTLLLLITTLTGTAQSSYNVLFLGNSYTGTNNLPQIIADVALSVGDTLVYDHHTPGGYQLIDHSTNPTSTGKIAAGGWDYVVMQGQSQEPITRFTDFRGGSGALFSDIKQYNPCATTLLYMTWGRENGDPNNCASFPVMCTYEGMDTTLRDRYINLGTSLNAEVAPVSVVWRYLRQNHPNIGLYQSDGSHPSAAGSYAAACCFYTMIFKKDPTLIGFNFGVNAADAFAIRNAVKTQVFDQLTTWDYKRSPVSNFRYAIGSGVNEVRFTPMTHGPLHQSYDWDFGDGNTSPIQLATHSYPLDGTYTVTLTTTNCDLQGTNTSTKDTVIQFCSHTPTIYSSSDPTCEQDSMWTQKADAYKWLLRFGDLIPETKQYVPHPRDYNSTGFAVLATVGSCTEQSQGYNFEPDWSGYYFDLPPGGDPCEGDTTKFVVLHSNGFLSGTENIFWFKNDTLLPLPANHDTLLITEEGKYECKIVNPMAACPFDTTYYYIEINCETPPTGIEQKKQEAFWKVFPNPAAESITVQWSGDPREEQIQFYNAMGSLVKEVKSTTPAKVDVSDMPNGLYFIRLKDLHQPAHRLVKH